MVADSLGVHKGLVDSSLGYPNRVANVNRTTGAENECRGAFQ